MKINVKTLKGTHFEIQVKPQDSVGDVKRNIEATQGADVYPAAQQMLIHQGKVLTDDTTLEENKVAENSFVVIMLSKNKVSSGGTSTASSAPTNPVNSYSACVTGEESLLDSLLATVASEDDGSTYAVLKDDSENESCKKLLTMWNCIKPSTRRVLSLVAKFKSLEIDKEHLRTNLHKAEEEVKLLFDENIILEEENKRLLRLCKERKHSGSDGKYTSSVSAKSNKRKSSPRTSSPLERKIDFDDQDSARQPLSPLGNN